MLDWSDVYATKNWSAKRYVLSLRDNVLQASEATIDLPRAKNLIDLESIRMSCRSSLHSSA